MNAVKGEAPSLVPNGRWQLVWNDEFTGNALVWDDVGLNPDKNGLWPFPKRAEPKFLHRYGYYECRCRLQRRKGWWSAFWMQAPGNGATLDPANCGVEQDIMESFAPGEIITHAYHMKGYGADYRGFNAYRMPGSVDCMKNPVWKLDTDEFHTFGLLWEEDGYTVFVVVPRKGSYWFLGRGDHGVFDFCDRILGVRQYFLENDIGRFAPKTRGLRVPQIEWRDKPVFAMRANYPWWASQWGRYLRDSGGGPVSRYPNLHVHPAGNLNHETNFNFGVRSPDIFEINADGKRNAQLCWGNPKALEAYKEIVTAGIEKGTPTYGIVDRWAKTVTVSQLDQGVHCHCERCQKLYDHSKAPNGDASPCIWGYFVKNLFEWMADKYPDWHIVILPYHNTCGCPEGLTFPRFELTRLWTRWSLYNNDQSAFGEFRFEE